MRLKLGRFRESFDWKRERKEKGRGLEMPRSQPCLLMSRICCNNDFWNF